MARKSAVKKADFKNNIIKSLYLQEKYYNVQYIVKY